MSDAAAAPMPRKRYAELMRLLKSGDITLEEQFELWPELARRSKETDDTFDALAPLIVHMIVGGVALGGVMLIAAVMGW
jgi:hypothetical protein